MKVTLNIKLTVEDRDVITKVGAAEGLEDMEISLLQNILRAVGETQKRVKKEVDRFYGSPEGTVEAPESAEEPKNEAEAAAEAPKTEEQE